MKKNPMFNFLNSRDTNISITQQDGYVMLKLNMPKHKPSIQVNGKAHALKEHHVSIYRTYEEGIGFKSLYHYSAYFTPWVVHIYFDKSGNHSRAFIRPVDTDETLEINTQELQESEALIIQALFNEYARDKIQLLHTRHAEKIQTLRTQFYPELKKLQEKLFDPKSDIVSMTEQIEQLLAIGHQLETVSFHRHENKRSLAFLEATMTLLKNPAPVETIVNDAVAEALDARFASSHITATTPTVERTTTDAEQTQSVPMHENNHSVSESNTALTEFSRQYAQVETLIEALRHKKLTEFESKVSLLNQIHSFWFALYSHADSLKSLKPNTHEHRTALYQASIGIDLLYQAYENAGTMTLKLCLSSKSNALLVQHGQHLVQFAPLVVDDRINSILAQDNTDALSYLIEHGQLNVDSYRVRDGQEHAHAMSLLAACYYQKKIKCFTLLAQHVHQLHDTDPSGYPLSHVLLQLPLHNEYRNIFIKKMNKDTKQSLFKNLHTWFSSRQSPTNSFTDMEQHRKFVLYYSNQSSLYARNALLPEAEREELLHRMFNQSVLEEVRNNPEYIALMTEKARLEQELRRITDKKRISAITKARSARLFKDVTHQIDENQVLQEQLRTMSLDTYLSHIRRSNQSIQDVIFLLENSNKPLSGKKATEFQTVAARQQAYETSLAAPQQSLSQTHSDFGKIFGQSFFHYISDKLHEESVPSGDIGEIFQKAFERRETAGNNTSPNSEEDDEFAALDFAAAAGP